MLICSMLTLKTVLKNQSKYLTYSHRTFGLYIFSYDNLSCAYYHMTFWVVHILIWQFELCILSYDILGCTYSHMTIWVVHIIWHFGFYLFSDDILGCTYSQESGNILFDDITISMVLFIVTLLFCLVWYRSKWLI
jgi:hypothetical protein